MVTVTVFPDVLAGEECDRLLADLAEVPRSRAGARHLMSHPAVGQLASDDRLRKIAGMVIGPTAIPFRATLLEKSTESNWLIAWHQDTALPLTHRFDRLGWGPWTEKSGIAYAHAPAWALSRIVALRVHLDASTTSNGPLRVIAGPVTQGRLTEDQIHVLAKTSRAIDCPVPRGGILVMRPLIVHASSKALDESPRRVLQIEYADSLDLAPGIRLAIV